MSKKASIFIIVLWALFFLSMLALAISAYIRPQIGLAGRLKDKLEGYYLAKAALQRAAYEVSSTNDTNLNYDCLSEPWSTGEGLFKEVALGNGVFSVVHYESDGSFSYGLIDEERKINVNEAPAEILKDFFVLSAGLTLQEAETIADSIVDWRDSDNIISLNGAEDAYYMSLSPAYHCKNQRIEILEELLLIRGMNQDIFDKIKDMITIYSTGRININTADKNVFLALGLSSSLVDRIMAFRLGEDQIEASSDDNYFLNNELIVDNLLAKEKLIPADKEQLTRLVSSGIFTTRSDNFSGVARGSVGSKEIAQISFVVDRNKKIKYWRQD